LRLTATLRHIEAALQHKNFLLQRFAELENGELRTKKRRFETYALALRWADLECVAIEREGWLAHVEKGVSMSLRHTRLVVGISTAAIVTAAFIVTSTKATAQNAPGGNGSGDGTGSTVSVLRVVDGGGRIVGTLVDGHVVARSVGGVTIDLWVIRSGFVIRPASVYYTSADCSGSALMAALWPLRQSLAIGSTPDHATTAMYPANPIQLVTVNSSSGVNPDGSLGPCDLTNSYTDYFGPLATFDLSAFTPPFEVQ
jgi:hypothetical protein